MDQSTTGQFATTRFTRESSEHRIAAAPPKLPPITKISSGDKSKRWPNAISRTPFGNSPDVENVEMRRLKKEFAVALPRAPVSWIKNPVTFLRKELYERLFAGHSRHAIADN